MLSSLRRKIARIKRWWNSDLFEITPLDPHKKLVNNKDFEPVTLKLVILEEGEKLRKISLHGQAKTPYVSHESTWLANMKLIDGYYLKDFLAQDMHTGENIIIIRGAQQEITA